MPTLHPALVRAEAFCEVTNLRIPILLAPMAGACPASLSIAVANAGGLGACGALLMQPAAIRTWASEVRAGSDGGFQLNLWIPDPAPLRDPAAEDRVRAFLCRWGPDVARDAGEVTPPDFAAQCEAMLDAGPAIISSIMGLYPPAFVAKMKARGIKWLATATTVTEAQSAESAGADAVVAQGMEAGGHRGAFDPAQAEANMVGLFSLLPAIVDAVRVPVIATGGIADARGGRFDPRGVGCPDRHRFPAVSRSKAAIGLGRRHRQEPAGADIGHARVLRPSGTQHRDRLCPRGHGAGRTDTCAVSRAARADASHA